MGRLSRAVAVATLLFATPVLAEQSYYVDHPLGFSVPVSIGAVIETHDDGFVIYPNGEIDVRTPTVVEVRLLQAADEPPPFPLDRTAQVEHATAVYGTRTETGGSGGTEYDLVVRWPMCVGTLEVRETQQHEFGGTPGFTDSWHIVEWARCTVARGTR